MRMGTFNCKYKTKHFLAGKKWLYKYIIYNDHINMMIFKVVPFELLRCASLIQDCF